MKKLALYISLALMTASCGVYTKYEQKTEVPENLYGLSIQATDTTSTGDIAWREMFTDPLLQGLIEKALNQNTDLLSASLRVTEAEAALKASKLAYLPAFALAPQGTVSSYDGGKASRIYSLPLTASWELDLNGKLRNSKKQAAALLAQSKDYQQAVQCQIIAAVANTYYTLLMLDEQLAITRSTIISWEETLEATRALYDAGMTNEIAVQQLQASVAGVKASELDLVKQIDEVENSMSLLLAETPHAISRGKLSDQQFTSEISAGVPLKLLASRPDVRAAERNLEKAFYATNSARSSFYPSLTLSGSVGWTNNSGIGIQNPAKILASAVASLTQPLFARGQLNAQLKIAKAQQEEAELQFTQTLLNAGVEVNDALKAYQTAKAKADLYASQVENLDKAYKNTMLLMEYGNATYIEVLNAQQTFLSAQLNQTANRFAEIQSVITLYNALGGGAK